MVVIYMHNSVPTTMKPAFYKPVLVLFFRLVSKRNLFLPNKFQVTKQNRAGLQSRFMTNTAHNI